MKIIINHTTGSTEGKKQTVCIKVEWTAELETKQIKDVLNLKIKCAV